MCFGEKQMSRMTITLPEGLEQKFKEKVVKRKGYKRGNIKESYIEAIKLWIRKENGKQKK